MTLFKVRSVIPIRGHYWHKKSFTGVNQPQELATMDLTNYCIYFVFANYSLPVSLSMEKQMINQRSKS